MATSCNSFNMELPQGTLIVGKWNRKRYRIERLLGEGANGKVYLVHHGRDVFALKLGFDSIDLQSEINVLKTLSGKQHGVGTPLADVDDLYGPDGKEYPFYVMRYVRGATASAYLNRQGDEWFPLVGLNILNRLSKLHRIGWIFGDLKTENIMIADYGNAELIDFGGATEFGKSVRQFTEIYDRGYWNAGSRMADANYDLFSFGVLCLQLSEPQRLHQLTKQLLPQNRSVSDLIEMAGNSSKLKPVRNWMSAAFKGEFKNTEEAVAMWRKLLRQPEPARPSGLPGWLKGLAIISAVMLTLSFIWWMRS